jgi:hypothetical protein
MSELELLQQEAAQLRNVLRVGFCLFNHGLNSYQYFKKSHEHDMFTTLSLFPVKTNLTDEKKYIVLVSTVRFGSVPAGTECVYLIPGKPR